MLIMAQFLGAETGVKTRLITGPEPQLYEQLNAAIKLRKEAEHKLEDIQRLLTLAAEHPERLPAEALKSAESTREAMTSELASLIENEHNLQTQVELMTQSRIVAEKKVHAGVEIQIGNKQMKITAEREAGYFHLKEGELSFS